jgi:hypothetical protein
MAMTETEKAEYDDVLRRLTAKCEELAAENARLRSSENTAHSVLREVYNDPSASPNVRVLAAKAAIAHESAPLKPVSPPLDLTAEPYEPLADVVARQRARADAMRPKLIEQTRRDNELARLAWRDGGHGDDSSND